MIEFKQIIGRGTRRFDDKYYFTIYDFVKPHHHFFDPVWDGDSDPRFHSGGAYPKMNPATGDIYYLGLHTVWRIGYLVVRCGDEVSSARASILDPEPPID